jgi:hypothetical protein
MRSPDVRLTVGGTLALSLAACFTMSSTHAENWISEDQVARIQRGKTTRAQIVDWLGPPAAVLRRGTVAPVPGLGLRRLGTREVHADAAFTLFDDRNPSGPGDVIYYYQSAEVKGSGVVVFVVANASQELHENRLWVLLNGEGTVRDFVHRRGAGSDSPPATAPDREGR